MAVGKYGQPCVSRHTALIYDRGGRRRVFQVEDLNQVEWGRETDKKSSARLVVTGRACRAQTGLLNSIEPRRHELVLFRGTDRVWEGPIVQVKSTSSRFELDANDIIEYLDNRPLSRAWPNADGGGEPIMTERLREILIYELGTNYTVTTSTGDVIIPAWENVVPSADILAYLDIRLGTTLTRAVTEAFEMSVGDHLYNLGRSVGVSYTTVGRRLVIWDGSLGRTRLVTEKDFSGDFEVIGSGADFFTAAHVRSNTPAADGTMVVGHATNNLDYYGPWARIIGTESEGTTDSAPSADSLRTQARRALTGASYPLPIVLNAANGASLIPSAGLTMDKLVAGTEIPVRAKKNIRDVKQLQRLDTLKVVETAAKETISVTLSAVGDLEEI